MATLSDLQARLESLRAQRATGVATVQFADNRQVVYRTDSQIAAAIADLERQIAVLSTTPVTTVRVAASKGLESEA